MAKKFTYSRSIHDIGGVETFEAVEFDSFDEARKVVDRAIYERRLELKAENDARRTTAGVAGNRMPPAAALAGSIVKQSTPTPPGATNSGDNGTDAPPSGNVQNTA